MKPLKIKMKAKYEMLMMQKKIQDSKLHLCNQAESCKGNEKMATVVLRKVGLNISVCLLKSVLILPYV